MKEWINNNKKRVAIGATAVIIIAGSILGINIKNYYEVTTTLYTGVQQEDGHTVSYDVDGIKNKEIVDKVQEILANAQVSEVTDETSEALEGRKLYFMIDYGTYTEGVPQNIVELWIQKDGSGIYREGLTKKYYTLDKEAVEQLEKLLK